MFKIAATKSNIALCIALLFHVSGAIGILCTPYADWFIRHTAFNLYLMALLLIWVQPAKNIFFFLFLLLAFITGMGTEMIGVNTGKLFGSYAYGEVLGTKFNRVPVLIGINWFVIAYCSSMILQTMHNWIEEKYLSETVRLSSSVQRISFIIDAALLATFFDWVMEPAAVKLGFWKWLCDGTIPTYNYTCWFLISATLAAVFRWFPFTKRNQFAVHLFIIQLLFFLLLRTFL